MPEVPLVPLVPDEPLDPEVPLVPEEPEVPLDPDDPTVPLATRSQSEFTSGAPLPEVINVVAIYELPLYDTTSLTK